MSANGELVSSLWQAWSAMDIDQIMGYFNEESVYTNIALGPPNVGLEAIRKAVQGFLHGPREIEFVVPLQLENGDGIVMNERIDRFLVGDKWVECLVMGVFEVKGDKILAWRDYFDREQFNSQFRKTPSSHR